MTATHGCAWLLQDRGYVVKEGRALRPESRGRVLSSFLRAFFPQYVDYGFTASLEEQLDEVSGPAPQLPLVNPLETHACPEECTASGHRSGALCAQGTDLSCSMI